MPLIPQGEFLKENNPNSKKVNKLRSRLNNIVPQKNNCMQCSADAAGYYIQKNI